MFKSNFFAARLAKNYAKIFASLPVGLLVSIIYAPRQVLREEDQNEQCEISTVKIDHSSYQLAYVNQGRLFTNCVTNISIISQKHLVPYVSWQYLNGEVLPDAANFSLNRKLLMYSPPKKFNCEVVSLLTGGGGNYNYYHWLFDCLSRLFIVKVSRKIGEGTKYLIPDDALPFQRDTLEALGIDAASRISSKKCRHLIANQLIVTSHPNPNPSLIPVWIIEFLRESFLRCNIAALADKKDFIYISREDSVNSRRLINESHLCKSLVSVGFGVYRLTELTFEQQVALFSQAKMIVGVHGAGLANLAFASKGAVVYELFSAQYQPDMFQRIALLTGLEYHRIVCEVRELMKPAQQLDFYIPEMDIVSIQRHAKKIVSYYAQQHA